MIGLGTSASSDRYDFSNPFISAVIVTETGRYPLWTNNTRALGSLSHGFTTALSFLSELSVEIQLAFLPKITATLTPPYQDALNFLDSDLMSWGTSTIEVQFGYVSDSSKNTLLSPVFSGILLKPDVQLGSEVVITLNAQGVSGLSASQQAGTRTINNQTRLNIIKAIAQGRVTTPRKESVSNFGPRVNYSNNVDPINLDQLDSQGTPGFVSTSSTLGSSRTIIGAATRKVKVDESEVTARGDQKIISDLTKEIKPSFVQGGRTDWQCIWALCEEAGCYFVWEGNTLKIIPKSKLYVGDEPKRFFRVYNYPDGAIGPAAGYFPILSASSPTMAVYLPGATKGIQNRGINPDTRQEEVINVNDQTEKRPRLNEGGVEPSSNTGVWGSVDDQTGDGQTTYPGESSDPDVKKMMSSEFDKVASGMGINLMIESLADPKLLPADVIDVSGLGRRLSRKYAVTKITYNLGLSGSSMSLECVSDTAAVDNVVRGAGPVAKTPTAPTSKSAFEVLPTTRLPEEQ